MKRDLESTHQGAFLDPKMQGGLKTYFLTPIVISKLVAKGIMGMKILER